MLKGPHGPFFMSEVRCGELGDVVAVQTATSRQRIGEQTNAQAAKGILSLCSLISYPGLSSRNLLKIILGNS
jgi:hypothetical protein